VDVLAVAEAVRASAAFRALDEWEGSLLAVVVPTDGGLAVTLNGAASMYLCSEAEMHECMRTYRAMPLLALTRCVGAVWGGVGQGGRGGVRGRDGDDDEYGLGASVSVGSQPTGHVRVCVVLMVSCSLVDPEDWGSLAEAWARGMFGSASTPATTFVKVNQEHTSAPATHLIIGPHELQPPSACL
jgi:hypothetical protein